jgi:hypothetical protein
VLSNNPRDGAVVGAAIGNARDSEACAKSRSSVMARQNFDILSGVDQAETEHLQRYAKMRYYACAPGSRNLAVAALLQCSRESWDRPFGLQL